MFETFFEQLNVEPNKTNSILKIKIKVLPPTDIKLKALPIQKSVSTEFNYQTIFLTFLILFIFFKTIIIQLFLNSFFLYLLLNFTYEDLFFVVHFNLSTQF